MRHLSRLLPHVVMIIFAAWCVMAVRGDLAQLPLAPLLKSWDLIALAALFSLLNYALRISRWRSYLARLGHPLGFRFTALTYCAGFAYTLSPGKIGEMIRARYYAPGGVPLSDVAAAFFAERLMDLLVMVALAALLFTASARYEGAIVGAAILMVTVLIALAVLPWASIARSLQSTAAIPTAMRSLLAGIATALASTRGLLRPTALLSGFLVGLLAWGLEGVGLGVLTSIFPSVHLNVVSAVGIYGVAVLIGGLSFLPGGLGSTEAVMTTLLVANGYSVSQGLLITLVCRLVTLWLAVCLGWIAVFALRQQESPVALSK